MSLGCVRSGVLGSLCVQSSFGRVCMGACQRWVATDVTLSAPTRQSSTRLGPLRLWAACRTFPSNLIGSPPRSVAHLIGLRVTEETLDESEGPGRSPAQPGVWSARRSRQSLRPMPVALHANETAIEVAGYRTEGLRAPCQGRARRIRPCPRGTPTVGRSYSSPPPASASASKRRAPRRMLPNE